MAVRKFDRASGQAYTESVSAPASEFSNGPSWIHETPFLPIGWEELNDDGAPSLMHSAMRKLLLDQRNITVPLFANVPWKIASYLWDCLGRSQKRTLHMWKFFATVYPDQFREIEQYRSMKIESPRVSMREYLGLVKSDSLSWRVVLTLGASYARVPELVGIAEIKNLVALEVAALARVEKIQDETIPMTALNDRILRTWSELTRTAGAFPHLRVLVLHRQTSLSRTSLRYLETLPSLRSIVAFECPGIASAFSHKTEADGWEIMAQEHSPGDNLYDYYRMSLAAVNGPESPTLAERPILDFRVGQKINKGHSAAQSVLCLQRTAASRIVNPELHTRKRKEQSSEAASGARKAVMRPRVTKSIDDMLKDFW
ncbi:hypothetical protein P175DRAFT_0561181 [Aspergillus ochraceoroseus IBT 24754]|uniref:Uncharacterized protein n=2 Tax=Aspergillus ochraceoroseus TaxID=138278 RepID=A0A2T5LLH5_9EURO|nr:uncharacterized protein P175DRAFT_0561181 [Aspergillus ochraceoroseus IBT 24754]KKK16088.1 hypothetical protein AOCH_006255 [Aspergillus ochraceoroseus]PTU17127.1 hypothetical protein P175DRAFT_0561181 [Aspergillus ochraceoroseus IBT 24754]